MSFFSALPSGGPHPGVVQGFLRLLIERGVVQAILVPTRQRHGGVVMPTLVTDPALLDHADPFAPVAWTNAGTLVSHLTTGERSGGVAAVVRSCEARAFVERTKLKQGRMDGVLLIGIDCLGRYENRAFLDLARRRPDLTLDFLRRELAGVVAPLDGVPMAQACTICEHPIAEAVDLRLCVIGVDFPSEILAEAVSARGKAALEALEMPPGDKPPGRDAAIRALQQQRIQTRDRLFAEFSARTNTLDGFSEVTAACVDCTNCRVACPVCYCRECVFVTETFKQEGARLMARSRGLGSLRMPADTLFYHLTRMAHMSTLCVGCGQCESACPNEIPLMLLFRTVSLAAQARFAYVPGRDPGEPQPLATYHDGEFEDVTARK